MLVGDQCEVPFGYWEQRRVVWPAELSSLWWPERIHRLHWYSGLSHLRVRKPGSAKGTGPRQCSLEISARFHLATGSSDGLYGRRSCLRSGGRNGFIGCIGTAAFLIFACVS